MRRWNGWGDTTTVHLPPPEAEEFLKKKIGAGKRPLDITYEQALKMVPISRFSPHPLISSKPGDRLYHARGQSLPDWIALRSGRIGVFPDGVAYPATDEEVRLLIKYANKTGTKIIPYGGGTSVVGHINPLSGEMPVLTVDMSRMNRMLHFDVAGNLATFGAGIAGPDLEAQLRARDCTLGHFPQSFELSTLGGWIAARSCGQQSLGYGRIERLFAGGHLEAPAGSIDIPAFPASAAGPDLREIIMGSEGRFGILTQATMRVSFLPEKEELHALFFPEFNEGCRAASEMLQAKLPLCMLRLSCSNETQTMLPLSGSKKLVDILECYLTLRRLDENKCLLLVGISGYDKIVRAARHEALDIADNHRAVYIGKTFGKQWHKNRFRTPYLRNGLWEMGYAVDTLETATDWDNLPDLLEQMESSLSEGLNDIGEKVHVFTHLSQMYAGGSSIYTSYIYRIADNPEETLRRWQVLKQAVSKIIVTKGGTISHQHGVGYDHLPYLKMEKGELGMKVIADMCRRFDPRGIMNPGKLINR